MSGKVRLGQVISGYVRLYDSIYGYIRSGEIRTC